MIQEMNPTYDEVLMIDTDDNKKQYFTLYARRKNIVMDSLEIIEDDCMVAYSDKSNEEIILHRSKLIKSGYYKPHELYVRIIPNLTYRKPPRNKK